MTGHDMPLEVQLVHLQRLAENALDLWDVPVGATARLINVSENTTFLIEAPGGYKAILRVHREGYHSRRAIDCELAWLNALEAGKVVATPGYYVGKNGEPVQETQTEGLAAPRFLVLFRFVEGNAPGDSGDITSGFEALGVIAARLHEHAIGWDKPAPFERLTWDVDSVFSETATWGNWRDAPGVTLQNAVTLELVEDTIRARLHSYGKRADRYNLIHADMRFANLLVEGKSIRLIDFDDCGYGWLMYDFAAAISFIEDDLRVPDLKSAWLKGYQSVRALAPQDIAETDTFIMLRRMALLAWIGSHIEAPEPQALAQGFAETTARLGQTWLDSLQVNEDPVKPGPEQEPKL